MTLTQINKAGLDEIALDHVFTIGASGSSAYTFQGEGLNGTVNNPTLYLTRGKTYRFENGSGGHPIRIQSTSGASGTAYNTGVTNNAGSGTVIVEVQHDAPDVLYYQCTSHAAMNGILYITGALADGGVTTAKIANDAVTTAKIADDAVTTAKIADDAVTNAKIGATAVGTTEIANNAVTSDKINTGQVTTAKLGDLAVSTAKLGNNAVTTAKIADSAITADKIGTGAVTEAKIADNAVTRAKIQNNAVNVSKIADQAVTLAKLEHGTSSNDGKFLRANNGADPTFETVNTDLVSDTSPQLGADLDVNDFNIKNGTSLVDITENDRIEVDIAGTEIVDINGNGVDVVGNIALTGVGKISTQGSTTQPFTFKNNSRTGTYNQSVMYAHQNNTSGNSNNGIVFEVGRLTDSSSAEIGKFTIATRGGSIATITDADGIKFNGDTAGANALDDYEEGTYTPAALSGGVGANTDGQYTKIGNFCLVVGSINFDNTGSGMCGFTLPFTASTGRTGSGVIRYSNRTSANEITFHVNANAAHVSWYQFGGGSYTYGDATTHRFDFTITYRTQ